MKKVIGLVITACLIFGLVACGSGAADNEANEVSDVVESADDNGSVDSGTADSEADEEPDHWEASDDNSQYELPEKVSGVFSDAMEDYTGDEMYPVAYIGTQVVAGTNHMILCRTSAANDDPAEAYKVVIIYEDLDGNSEITSIANFDFRDSLGEGGAESGQLAGGWYVPEEDGEVSMPEHVSDVYHTEIDSMEWIWHKCTPIAILGTEVVEEAGSSEEDFAGTRYAFLCKGYTDDGIDLVVVVVSEDNDGYAALENTSMIDLAKFAE